MMIDKGGSAWRKPSDKLLQNLDIQTNSGTLHQIFPFWFLKNIAAMFSVNFMSSPNFYRQLLLEVLNQQKWNFSRSFKSFKRDLMFNPIFTIYNYPPSANFLSTSTSKFDYQIVDSWFLYVIWKFNCIASTRIFAW